MAKCVSMWIKEINGQRLNLPCGKCFACRSKRASGWSFRLIKEAERSSSALFVTLTYDPEKAPTTENGFMTLWKGDVQKFFKRLRKLNKNKLKYYAVGEYGGKTMRPHYHIILFNADIETIDRAWKLDDKEIGYVHIGEVTPASVGYTLKYISKIGKIPLFDRDDRVPEFSLMSKGLGSNYLTENMINYHRNDLLNRMHITIEDGKKLALPRYYKEKIYEPMEKQWIGLHLENVEREKLKHMNLSTKNAHWDEEIRNNLAKQRKFEKSNIKKDKL